MERCEVCGFAWDAVGPDRGRRRGPGRHRGRGRPARGWCRPARPAADRRPWSPLEYACHVRGRAREPAGPHRPRPGGRRPHPPPDARDPPGRPRALRTRRPGVTARDPVSAGEAFARTLECLPEGRPTDPRLRLAPARRPHHRLGGRPGTPRVPPPSRRHPDRPRGGRAVARRPVPRAGGPDAARLEPWPMLPPTDVDRPAYPPRGHPVGGRLPSWSSRCSSPADPARPRAPPPGWPDRPHHDNHDLAVPPRPAGPPTDQRD